MGLLLAPGVVAGLPVLYCGGHAACALDSTPPAPNASRPAVLATMVKRMMRFFTDVAPWLLVTATPAHVTEREHSRSPVPCSPASPARTIVERATNAPGSKPRAVGTPADLVVPKWGPSAGVISERRRGRGAG